MKAAEFKAFRVDRRLTQHDMARLLHVSPGTIYNWESGRTPISHITAMALITLNLSATSR